MPKEDYTANVGDLLLLPHGIKLKIIYSQVPFGVGYVTEERKYYLVDIKTYAIEGIYDNRNRFKVGSKVARWNLEIEKIITKDIIEATLV